MRRILYLFVLPLLLAACVSVGNKQLEDPELVTKIVPGKSTKAEVRTLAGEPSRTTFTEAGDEIWEYMLHKGQTRAASFIPFVGILAGGMDMQTYTLTVRFRKDGVVSQVGSGKTTGGAGAVTD